MAETLPSIPERGVELFAAPGREAFGSELFGHVLCPEQKLATGQVACLSREPKGPLVIIPPDSGPTRWVFGEGLRYLPAGSRTSLLVVVAPSAGCAPGLYAFDPLTLEPRWHITLEQAEARSPAALYVGGHEESGMLALRVGALPESGAPPPPGELLLVRAATGEVVWRRRLSVQASMESFSGSQLLFTDTNYSRPDAAVLIALSALDGRELWRAKYPAHARDGYISGGSTAALIERSPSSTPELPEACRAFPCAFDLQLSETQSGDLRWRVPLGTSDQFSFSSLTLDGSDVYTDVPAEERGFPSKRVAAFDARTGRERWSVGPVVCSMTDPRTELAVTPTALYALMCDDVLRVISRADGRVMFERGAALSSLSTVDDTWALLDTSSGLARIHWAALAPARAVSVRGRVKLRYDLRLSFPRWVRIGPRLVKTDRAGRFHTVLKGQGDYSADVPGADEPFESPNVHFTLDTHRAEVTLELEALPPH